MYIYIYIYIHIYTYIYIYIYICRWGCTGAASRPCWCAWRGTWSTAAASLLGYLIVDFERQSRLGYDKLFQAMV